MSRQGSYCLAHPGHAAALGQRPLAGETTDMQALITTAYIIAASFLGFTMSRDIES